MLDKTYNPSEIEPRLYEGWERAGAFAADLDSNATPYTIMIPPPNVTGSLHMGHALTFTVQDTLIRWRRMEGRDVLWQPGTDHAGIATQMVVERLLAEQGTDRRALGREGFVERVWQWKAESGGTITRQLRRLGASLDWPRERFTMDDGLSAAVRKVFVTLYREGLIYRDRRLVNWDPKLQTAISDLEVENLEVKGHLWYIRYPIEGAAGRFITVATTRPETMLGDTAVAVHPEDARFADLVGQFAVLPLVGRRLPIVADEYSDPEKGTGAVKITPAHDFNDFGVGQRHGLPMPSILDRQAHVALAEIADVLAPVDGVADPGFVRSLEGMDRAVARKAIVAELDRLGLLEKTEPYTHQVPHGDRGGVPIEPLLTTQWYCNAEVLAKPAIEAVESGRTVFVPKQWENTFFAWMRDIQPWCISRQLWWGHRIPCWYSAEGTPFVAETEAEAKALARAHFGTDEVLTQDEDVLDTWFSSGLWPFSTLGWPERTKELARYYPGDVLVTGFDIIFFWVARMMMQGIHFMGEVPFRTVYIHGLVRDERGQKMSKSKGNIIDPLELIDRYGADALRFTICALTGPGRDVKLGAARVESYRRFVTKLWNAARFCEMNAIRPDASFDPSHASLPLTRWILDAMNRAIEQAGAALEDYRFDEYAAACYRFTWDTFCDWFVEFAKPVLAEGDSPAAHEVRQTTAHVLGTILRLLHPAMPFVTEELWDRFGYGDAYSLIRAAWPEPVTVADASAARDELDWVVRLISEVRSVRTEMGVPPRTMATLYCWNPTPQVQLWITTWAAAFQRLAYANPQTVTDSANDVLAYISRGSAHIIDNTGEYWLQVGGIVDVPAQRARLKNERDKAIAEARKIAQKLDNVSFVERAPGEVVAENRERLAAAHADIARLGAALQRIENAHTGEDQKNTRPIQHIVFACDESGAKGYADGDEAFPGQVGVFAGIMVPEELIERVTRQFDAIVAQYTPPTGKLHIADLPRERQAALRNDIFAAITDNGLPCFWYAVHVAGFNRAYLQDRSLTEGPHLKGQSRIKPSGNSLAAPSLHIELFEGLYSHLIAFCEERGKTDLAIDVRTDNVDAPIAKDFSAVAKGLLDFSPTTRTLTGFDTATNKVVKTTVRSEIQNPEALGITTRVHSLRIAIAGDRDGTVLAADVLANSLAHLFNHRPDQEKFRALNRPEAIVSHPLAQHLDTFSNWGNYSLADTLYRHPKDPEAPSGQP